MEFKNTKEKMYTGETKKKPVRSRSGVTPLTVVLKPRKCDHGTCIYCPGGDHVPQSYTDKSPAIMRAMSLNYDAYEQVVYRLKVLENMNHSTEKIELILLGGTFLQYPLEYQYEFIKKCYDALNGSDSKDLEEAKKINETAKHRMVAMCIENRPDNCSEEEIKRMREFGCTRVEIGVQIPDDEIYKKINRGHTVKDVIGATRRLKDAGFKVGYHLMPGLPFSNYENDLEKFRTIFSSIDFRPDQLKIYPCQIVSDSPLAKSYKKIGYVPFDTQKTKKIVAEIIRMVPEYCRIMRIMREIPKEKMLEPPIKLDLRKDIEDKFRDEGIKVKEIRMREVGFNDSEEKNLNLRILEYDASGGKEYFLEVIDSNEVLYGLLRLRFTEGIFLDEIKNCALIREIHVYGRSLNIGEKNGRVQHTGIGKWLMSEAEKIVREKKIKKIAVISGVGVREYYRKLGYGKVGEYMVKELTLSA